jgi:predicted glutamine amidotransferase
MCELFAMSAKFPTTVRLSLDELARHGGGTGPHRDGWGLALWQDGDALVLREPEAANESRWVKFIQELEPRTTIALAHVRKATQGARVLANTQPFTRELGGRMHIFAHNGMLSGIEARAEFSSHRFRRVGDTDSEQAFGALLDRLAPLYESAFPALDARLEVIRAFAARLRELGPANFVYSDGDAIFAHGHRRTAADGVIRPPGLHFLCRSCEASHDVPALVGVSLDPVERQEVALAASVPLSAEDWEPLGEGEIVVMREGRVVERSS